MNRILKESGNATYLFFALIYFTAVISTPAWIILSSSSFLDVYVDMIGAFTTTGLSIFENDLLSRPIHLWRAIIAWFGGGLIWIAAFVILLPANRGGLEFFLAKM